MKRAIFSCALVVITVTQAFSNLPAHAGETYYRWMDDRGRPVHSDRPPPKGVDYEVVSTGSTLVRPVEADQGAVPAEVTPTVGNEFEKVQTKPTPIAKNPEYCARAQENLYMLNKVARIRLRDENGEYRYIDEEEKERQRQNAIKTIAIHCD